jgi:YD repeat-containing protein
MSSSKIIIMGGLFHVDGLGDVEWRWVADGADVMDAGGRIAEHLPSWVSEMWSISQLVSSVEQRAFTVAYTCHASSRLVCQAVSDCVTMTNGSVMAPWTFMDCALIMRVKELVSLDSHQFLTRDLLFRAPWTNGTWRAARDVQDSMRRHGHGMSNEHAFSGVEREMDVWPIRVLNAVGSILQDAIEALQRMRRYIQAIGRLYCEGMDAYIRPFPQIERQAVRQQRTMAKALRHIHRVRHLAARRQLATSPVLRGYVHKCMSNPGHRACQVRLRREFEELQQESEGC